MEQFEYKVLKTETKGFTGGKVDMEEYQEQLNQLGIQGWELVSAVPTARYHGETRWIISVLKRRLPQ